MEEENNRWEQGQSDGWVHCDENTKLDKTAQAYATHHGVGGGRHVLLRPLTRRQQLVQDKGQDALPHLCVVMNRHE